MMTPDASPPRFKDHVVEAVLNRDPGVTLDEIASDFGMSAASLGEWMQFEPGDREPLSTDCDPALIESRQLAEQIRALEQEKLLLQQIVDRLAPLD